MGEKVVRFSDLSGQMADEAAGGLTPLVVTDYPDADPDQRVRIEVTPEELEKIGKLSIAAVGLETEPTNEQEKRSRFVVPVAKLAALATVGPIEEVLANAQPVVPPKSSRRSQVTDGVHTTNGRTVEPLSITTTLRMQVCRIRARSVRQKPLSCGITWNW